MIVPGPARLAFTITLNSEDANRTVVQSLGRAIVKKLTNIISGNEVMSIDDSYVGTVAKDLALADVNSGRILDQQVLPVA